MNALPPLEWSVSASLPCTLSQPRRHKVEPSALAGAWGAAGCDSRGRLVRFLLAHADDELWHGEATRGCAWRFEPLTSILSVSHAPHTHHSHESSISHLADYEFAYARSAPRLRSTGAIFACVILVRSFFLRTNPCAQLCTCSVPSCCRVVPCGYCGMRHVSWSSCVMNWA